MKKNTLITILFLFCILVSYGQTEPKPAVNLVPFSMNWENSKDSKLNLSFMLDKPAGKDGFITIKDGHFVKPNGDRFKIWGVNLSWGACLPEKKDAAAYAAFIARFGINAVRLHFLDSNYGQEHSLFDYEINTTRKLKPEQLDKLDYFISELKKAGIYTDFNLNVGRTYRKEDGVPEYDLLGFAKGITLFDEYLIELQKEYARQLFTHVNPYTGNAYSREPSILITEIVNENSLIEAWWSGRLIGKNTTPANSRNSTWRDISPYYGKELTSKYNIWLRRNSSPAEIKTIEKESGTKEGEEIPRLSPLEFPSASALRFGTEAKFIISLERKFYSEMYHYLKNELRIKSSVVANSDNEHRKNSYALVSNLAVADVVDGHSYWQLASARVDEKTGKSYTAIPNTPMVNDPGFSTAVKLSRSAVEGKPFTVSETNHSYPSEFTCEGIPIIGAYALLQDWDGIFYYTLEHVPIHSWKDTTTVHQHGQLIDRPNDLSLDPVKMSGLAAIGLMFLRNDLKASTSCVYRGYTTEMNIEGIRDSKATGPLYTQGFSPLLPLMEKTRIKSFENSVNNFPVVENSNVIKAKTGEINWHVSDRSFVEVAAPKTESVVGYMPESVSLLNHMKVKIQNEFAAITLISLEDQPIATSGKLLLVANGRTGRFGMKWSEDKKRLLEPGGKLATIEVIKGEILLSGLKNAKTLTIETLNGGGNPIFQKKLPVLNGNVNLILGENSTVWYLLTIKR